MTTYKNPLRIFTLILLALCLFAAGIATSAHAENIIQDNDRIVFIGDSITGQGAKGGPNGWIGLIGEGLSLERPSAKPALIGLGGSGSTVGAWVGHEKNSREKVVTLDVKEIEVGKTLDAGAEIIIIMLGMNDALSPSLKNVPAEFDAWEARYLGLVEALCARAKPRVVALAKVTPCTEDPASPKNQVIAELNNRIEKIAKDKNYKLLPTNEASYEVLALGRTYNPEFHVAGDMVHPSGAGHVAIAVGMLRGLGEEKAAAKLLEKKEALYKPAAAKFPILSYTLTKSPSTPDDEARTFTINYFWTPSTSQAAPTIKVALPEGWKANPENPTGAKGQITVTGPLNLIENKIILTATSGSEKAEQTVSIPAGWRIAVGRGKGLGWVKNSEYTPEQDRQPLDETLGKGEGFTAPLPFPEGDPAPWTDYVASANYTGGSKPGSIDMAAVLFFSHRNQAYGARWIYSSKDRPVDVNYGSQGFAGMRSMAIWLNGKTVFEGKSGAKATTPSELKKGWNLLLFKSTFIQWQWTFFIDLAGQQGDDLSDLRYATKPPAL